MTKDCLRRLSSCEAKGSKKLIILTILCIKVEEGNRARVALEMRCLELEEMADKWEGERLENARLLEEEKAAARYIYALLKIKEKSKEETKGMVERRYSFLPFFLYHSFSIPLTLGFIYFLLFPFSLALGFKLRTAKKVRG